MNCHSDNHRNHNVFQNPQRNMNKVPSQCSTQYADQHQCLYSSYTNNKYCCLTANYNNNKPNMCLSRTVATSCDECGESGSSDGSSGSFCGSSSGSSSNSSSGNTKGGKGGKGKITPIIRSNCRAIVSSSDVDGFNPDVNTNIYSCFTSANIISKFNSGFESNITYCLQQPLWNNTTDSNFNSSEVAEQRCIMPAKQRHECLLCRKLA
ncbi:hypothetical protein TRFO_31448 [Tritrichomonas foetus]|uniref:Uncharacterized protein n=1 Tax=Tritrichomonas foetus TaxID=1144522 RepID=A0A1J4JRC8_9EUKA|nr:hypothetical protein TRFO_31448 [Tritrichomonas foetus]|eukprot:OHT01665.1 hypothetical protein TRFO_31448 [Tritrichomonas foetus]